MGPLLRIFNELKRRRVFGSIAAYVVLGALLIELSGAIFEALLFPEWSSRLVVVLLILGLPVVAVLSWFFDLSAEGIERADDVEAGKGTRAVEPPREAGLDAALRQSRGAPVPAEPVRRRRPPSAEAANDEAGPGAEPVEVDEARVRAAALGHVRHELRTPINGIIGYSEMLLEDASDEELVADLERIRQAGHQLLDRVDTLLLRDAAPEDMPGELESFAEKVRLELRTPVSAVVGYSEMLLESCEEAGQDELVPDLERIRTSAHRLLERSEDIVRLATQSDGGVKLGESEALTERVLSKIRPVSGAVAPPEADGRLLVVDDNETNRDLISRQLARFGYTVATAVDGQEALDRLQEQDFDLVLLDVIMPRLDGVETLKRLRQQDRLAETPVIMLSSLNELDSAVRCIEMGATDYIAKPVQASLLEARIAAALEVRDLRGREAAYRRRVEADARLIDRLLDGAFPAAVVERVREGSLEIRERYAQATVVRATYATDQRPTSGPDGLDRLERLQTVARTIEELAQAHGVESLIWRPDGFVAVLAADVDTADAGAGFALDVRDKVVGVAIGMHVGPVVAAVVGEARPRFDVWGEGVDAAEALAGHASSGGILVTPTVRSALGDAYATEARGVKEIRGRGQMRLYSLVPSGESDAAAIG